MALSLHITAYLSCLLFVICAAKIRLHMFQLNSYSAKSQIRWCLSVPTRALPFIGAALLAAVALFFADTAADIIIGDGMLALSFTQIPKPAKKPLVMTARAWRLIITDIILYGIVLAAAFAAGGKCGNALAVFGAALSPLILLLANFINKPIEYAVRRHYINDAKKILAACPDLKIIGITGSYGKTSVKYFLSSLLGEKYDVLMTPESYNTPMGIVKTIRGNLTATNEAFVCEMGAKYVGDIKEICDIVHPHDAIITSLGHQHLETFGSEENIIKTKYELADTLPADGKLFINISNELIDTHRPKRAAITYGLRPDADYYAKDISVTSRGTDFTLVCADGECEYSTSLIGKHNVINILGAIALCHEYGVALENLRTRVRRLECVPHRLQLIDRGGILIIDDAYNSNPNGCKVALETLSVIDGLKIVVTPGMIELGGDMERCNYEFGKEMCGVCDYIVLVGERQTKHIANGVRDGGFDEAKLHIADSINDAMNFVYSIASDKKKIILLENDLPDNF